jgi:WD40 repeat protein
MRSDGSNQRIFNPELFGKHHDLSFRNWSPDGSFLLADLGYGSSEIGIISFDTIGGQATSIDRISFGTTADHILDPTWSPNGKYIAIGFDPASTRETCEIWIVTPEGKLIEKVVTSGYNRILGWSSYPFYLYYLNTIEPNIVLRLPISESGNAVGPKEVIWRFPQTQRVETISFAYGSVVLCMAFSQYDLWLLEFPEK